MESRLMPPVSRRDVLKLGGSIAAASALGLRHGESLADGDPPPAKAKQPDRGGTFRIRIGQSPAHFDPHQTAAYSTMVPLSFAYSRLVMIKPGSAIVPEHAAPRQRPRAILGPLWAIRPTSSDCDRASGGSSSRRSTGAS
mgnify:CR=1 FL=1